MKPSDARRLLLDRFGLRVEPMMGRYVAQRLGATPKDSFPVMGGDARTGVPIRTLVDPRQIDVDRTLQKQL